MMSAFGRPVRLTSSTSWSLSSELKRIGIARRFGLVFFASVVFIAIRRIPVDTDVKSQKMRMIRLSGRATAKRFRLYSKWLQCISSGVKPTKKGKPVPVRFARADSLFLEDAAEVTGLCQAEIVRRAVRLVEREKRREGSFGFLIELAA
jgi:hypothetical protein